MPDKCESASDESPADGPRDGERDTREFDVGGIVPAMPAAPPKHSRPSAWRRSVAWGDERFSPPLPEDLIRDFCARAQIKRVGPKVPIAEEGMPSSTFCVILRGSVRNHMVSTDGQSLDLGILQRGEYFGESMIAGGGRLSSVVTLEPCELACVSRPQFFALLEERPDFVRHVMLTLVHRLRRLAEIARRLAHSDVATRVRELLIELGEPRDGGLIVRPRPSQQALADRVGASRSMVNRVMKDFVADGFVTVQGDALLLRPGA